MKYIHEKRSMPEEFMFFRLVIFEIFMYLGETNLNIDTIKTMFREINKLQSESFFDISAVDMIINSCPMDFKRVKEHIYWRTSECEDVKESVNKAISLKFRDKILPSAMGNLKQKLEMERELAKGTVDLKVPDDTKLTCEFILFHIYKFHKIEKIYRFVWFLICLRLEHLNHIGKLTFPIDVESEIPMLNHKLDTYEKARLITFEWILKTYDYPIIVFNEEKIGKVPMPNITEKTLRIIDAVILDTHQMTENLYSLTTTEYHLWSKRQSLFADIRHKNNDLISNNEELFK